MKTVVITGCTGVLATKFIELYHDVYRIIGISRKQEKTIKNKPISIPFYAYSQYSHIQINDLYEDKNVVIEEILQTYGSIDCWINNAASSVWETPALYNRGFLDELKINVVAPFEISCLLWQSSWFYTPEDNKANNRSIVNVSSTASLRHYSTEQTCYAASKVALNRITQDLSKSFEGIRVNAIAPNSFPSIVTVEEVCREMVSLIEGSMNGEIREINGPI